MEQSIVTYDSNQLFLNNTSNNVSSNDNIILLTNQAKFKQFINNGYCCDDCKKIFINYNDELIKIETNISIITGRFVLQGTTETKSSMFI